MVIHRGRTDAVSPDGWPIASDSKKTDLFYGCSFGACRYPPVGPGSRYNRKLWIRDRHKGATYPPG